MRWSVRSMKRNMLNKYLWLAIIGLGFGCTTKKILVKDAPVVAAATRAADNNAIADSIRAHRMDFETLSIKAKADIASGKEDRGTTMTIRIQKDKAIWMSVVYVIEAARIMITPDSVLVMNKIDKTIT